MIALLPEELGVVKVRVASPLADVTAVMTGALGTVATTSSETEVVALV